MLLSTTLCASGADPDPLGSETWRRIRIFNYRFNRIRADKGEISNNYAFTSSFEIVNFIIKSYGFIIEIVCMDLDAVQMKCLSVKKSTSKLGRIR